MRRVISQKAIRWVFLVKNKAKAWGLGGKTYPIIHNKNPLSFYLSIEERGFY